MRATANPLDRTRVEPKQRWPRKTQTDRMVENEDPDAITPMNPMENEFQNNRDRIVTAAQSKTAQHVPPLLRKYESQLKRSRHDPLKEGRVSKRPKSNSQKPRLSPHETSNAADQTPIGEPAAIQSLIRLRHIPRSMPQRRVR